MKVLIVDEMHESIVQMPVDLGLEVDYFPNLGPNEVDEIVAQYDGLIIRSKFSIDDAFLEKAANLKFIGRAGAGLDLIDLEACKRRGVEVFAANEANRVAVAEHLIGMILSLFNNIHVSFEQVKVGKWLREQNRGEELFGKTVGLIGYGNNGQATAERLVAFGCKVLAYDKYRYGFGNHLVKECTMTEIFREAEIVSLHIPLAIDTFQMCNQDFFDSFAKPIFFCNVARGELVVQTDLLHALQVGKVKGACLDVLENEKLNSLTPQQKEVFDQLIALPQVLVTPHVAGWTFESYKKINDVLRDKIKRYLAI
ncbi:MAG: NAD(P)-dependent oxidoreductase [Spirosomataceae bacterium]